LIEKVCSPKLVSHPFKLAVFMAGSLGAGKTESALELEDSFQQNSVTICHIEQDRIKELLPEYTPDLAPHYHQAASLGVEKIYDYILKQGFSFIMDSTLSQYEKAKENITRALNKGYDVNIYFIYQPPRNAWFFV